MGKSKENKKKQDGRWKMEDGRKNEERKDQKEAGFFHLTINSLFVASIFIVKRSSLLS